MQKLKKEIIEAIVELFKKLFNFVKFVLRVKISLFLAFRF